ncbi:hypothetical protein AB0C95_21635 [Streptomyces caniferus]|uniref:hypothetical protein n=1 Tax=Streptomyces caniferus TaxID=285557 RepID=UPI0033E30A41
MVLRASALVAIRGAGETCSPGALALALGRLLVGTLMLGALCLRTPEAAGRE